MYRDDERPQLRALDFQPVTYQGQRLWYARDPLALSDQQLLLPEALALLAELCNGRRTHQELGSAFARHTGSRLDPAVIEDTLAQLDEAYLLQNERSRRMLDKQLSEFRSQPFRPPALAGHGYPADPRELHTLLESYIGKSERGSWQGRALLSPHIDYQRGGEVYARVWQQAAEAVLAADLVVILGTDHMGGLGTVTLTELPYATPYGVLPADRPLVQRLAGALGPAAAFADELNHRQEHSVELSAVWLHHVTQRAGAAPKPMVPVLVGSFQHFVMNGGHPAKDGRLRAFVDVLRDEVQTRRILTVASVDLAHVGPAFGDSFSMDEARREALALEDEQLLRAALHGDAQQWYTQIADVQDRNRICGFSPTYLLLDMLGEATGTQLAYTHCAADPQDTSLVSICGLLLE